MINPFGNIPTAADTGQVVVVLNGKAYSLEPDGQVRETDVLLLEEAQPESPAEVTFQVAAAGPAQRIYCG